MMRSMTGFGKSELRTKHGLFAVEIKTLNHKFLEITPKLPNSLAIFEDRIKNILKDEIKRGKVYLNLIHDTAKEEGENIFIDGKLAKNYLSKLRKLKKQLKIEEPLKLSDIVCHAVTDIWIKPSCMACF